MPDAAEAALAGDDFRLQHGLARFAQQQIGVADDAGADRGRSVAAARAHRRHAIGEFDLADRAATLPVRAARYIERQST